MDPQTTRRPQRCAWSAAAAGLCALMAIVCLPLCGPAGSAHAAESASVQRTLFDHLTTGFELTGQHRDLPCESCHVNAIFKGTPRDCEQCHGVGTSVRASAKPANHILSTNNCWACHTPVAWSPAVNFSHNEVTGSCVSCHYAGSPVRRRGPESHCYRPGLQRLPLDHRVGRRRVQSQRPHHGLRNLPQQCERQGTACHAYPDDSRGCGQL